MSAWTREDSDALKIFFRAYVNDPQEPGMAGLWSKQQIRDYRSQLLDEAQKQRADNPIAPYFLRELSYIPLRELAVVMSNMRRIYDELQSETGGAK